MKLWRLIMLWMRKLLDTCAATPGCIDSHKWETKIETLGNLSRTTR
jgi:hypothetical protein